MQPVPIYKDIPPSLWPGLSLSLGLYRPGEGGAIDAVSATQYCQLVRATSAGGASTTAADYSDLAYTLDFCSFINCRNVIKKLCNYMSLSNVIVCR